MSKTAYNRTVTFFIIKRHIHEDDFYNFFFFQKN